MAGSSSESQRLSAHQAAQPKWKCSTPGKERCSKNQRIVMSLSTNYLGLVLKNPIVASSSPLSHTIDSIQRLEDAGASAVVMYSLFEEQITFESLYVDHYLRTNTNSYAESLNYFPEMDQYHVWPYEYLKLIRLAKESVDIPI